MNEAPLSLDDHPVIATAVRTLVASGYTITNFDRQAVHAEFFCERIDSFGATIKYLVLVAESGPAPAVIEARSRHAIESGRVLVLVSESAAGALSWSDFIARLGGAVPNWRALASNFPSLVRTAGLNVVPVGLEGEAWRIFEDAVADGLEFSLGRRVRRLGNRRRGLRVPDLISATPDNSVLVIDTKASREPFDVGFPDLRPLIEYIGVQHVRQTGSLPVRAALLVSPAFHQNSARLAELSGEFISETQVPVTFLTVDAMLRLV